MADVKGDIEKYRSGELTPAEMHALEKRALNDPFLADALEGAESVSAEDFSADVAELERKLSSDGKKNRWFTPLRIAAGVVIIIAAGIALFYPVDPSENQLASQKNEPIVSTDSIADGEKPESKPEGSKLLSLNQAKPNESVKNEKDAAVNSEAGPSLAKPSVAGETTATGSGALSSEPAPVVADEQVKTDQLASSEISEDTFEDAKTVDKEKIAAAPIPQSFKIESADTESASRAKAARRTAADDLASEKRIISGQVTSLEDGQPIPGASITIKGSTQGTVTDLQGNYSLPLSENQPLVVSFIGYQSSEVVPDGKSTLNVSLKEDMTQLSEVVVTGLGYRPEGEEKEPVIRLADPVGGKRAYNKYLEGNLRYPQQALENNVKGKVTINFTVSTDGTLGGFTVTKSLGYGCDDEVIRLVKDGPKWNPGKVDNVAVESTVRVKMKFDPAKAKK